MFRSPFGRLSVGSAPVHRSLVAVALVGAVIWPGATVAMASADGFGTVRLQPAQEDPDGDQLLPPSASIQVITQDPAPLQAPAQSPSAPPPGSLAPPTSVPPSESLAPPTSIAPPETPAPDVTDAAAGGTGGGLLGAALVVLSVMLLAGLIVAHLGLRRAFHTLREAEDDVTVPPTAAGAVVPPATATGTSFSLLLPGGNSVQALEVTLDSLIALDHPVFEVLVMVTERTGEDPLHDAATTMAQRHPGTVKVVDCAPGESDEEALTSALSGCQGDVVATFEPGDLAHPGLLGMIQRRFTASGASAVRSAATRVDLYSGWWSRHQSISAFLSLGARLAEAEAAELVDGAATVLFVRTEQVRTRAGWEVSRLRSDRWSGDVSNGDVSNGDVSADDDRARVAPHAEVTTAKGELATVRVVLSHRHRQDAQRLTALRRAQIASLPTRSQRWAARAMTLAPLARVAAVVAGLTLLAGVVVGAVLVEVPVFVLGLALVPLLVLPAILAVRLRAFAQLTRMVGVEVGSREYVQLTLWFLPFQLCAAWSALRALDPRSDPAPKPPVDSPRTKALISQES